MNLEVRTVTGPAGSYDVSSDPVLACVIGEPVDDGVRVVDRDLSNLPMFSCSFHPVYPVLLRSTHTISSTESILLYPLLSSMTYHVGIYPIRLVQRGKE